MNTQALDSSSDPLSSQEVLLYRSYGISSLRFLAMFALALAVGGGIFALLLVRGSSGGPAVSDVGDRIGWAVVISIICLGFFAAVIYYQRHVAARITFVPDRDKLRVTTPTLFGMSTTEIPMEDLMLSKYHDGDQSGEEAASPPWLWVKVRGKKSFVVTLNGEIPNKERLMQVLHATR